MHPSKKEAVVYRKLDDQGLALDPESDMLYGFNKVARAIWELCDGKSAIAEIASVIAQDYEVDYNRALQDTRDFLSECVRRGLLLTSDPC